jgi:hypothetical protein
MFPAENEAIVLPCLMPTESFFFPSHPFGGVIGIEREAPLIPVYYFLPARLGSSPLVAGIPKLHYPAARSSLVR